MKIIDTTTYFEEKLMMDLRFKILNPYVDQFIVCEARFTHSGKEKEINFIIEPYTRFKGLVGEQATMFFKDPSGNALEFKSFKNEDQIFAT